MRHLIFIIYQSYTANLAMMMMMVSKAIRLVHGLHVSYLVHFSQQKCLLNLQEPSLIFLTIFFSNFWRFCYHKKGSHHKLENPSRRCDINFQAWIKVWEQGAPLPGNDKENLGNHRIDVIGICGGVFILKPCSWGRNHFIHSCQCCPLNLARLPCP